jgi:hypothetical protein
MQQVSELRDIVMSLEAAGYYLPSTPQKSVRRNDYMRILQNPMSCLRKADIVFCDRAVGCSKLNLIQQIYRLHHYHYDTAFWIYDVRKVDKKYLVNCLYTLDPHNFLFATKQIYPPRPRNLKGHRKLPLKEPRPSQPPLILGIKEEIGQLVRNFGDLMDIREDYPEELITDQGLGGSFERLRLMKRLSNIYYLMRKV